MARGGRRGGRTRNSRKGASTHADKYASMPKFDNDALNARFEREGKKAKEEAERAAQAWRDAPKPSQQELPWYEEYMEQERRLLS